MDFQQLTNIIKQAGIVGAGGAGFPLHAKLNTQSEYIIINGAECEPLLCVDQHLMDKYAKELFQTLDILLKVTGAKVGIFGLKSQYKKAIKSLQLENKSYKNIRVEELSNTYPSGDEVTLIYECVGRVVSRGALPITQKVTVLNVETLLNVWDAISTEKPVTHTYVTIGADVANPATIKVPIGMKVGELIQLAGREDLENHTIIMGGPMTGNIISPNDVVSKTTKGLLVLENNHYLVRRKEPTDFNSLKRIMSSCSQCRRCTDLCPRYILGHKVEPHKLMNAVANGLMNHSEACETALGCCGCNLCSLYACHHELDPAGFMMKIKDELISHGVKVSNEKEKMPDEWLDYHKVPSSRLIKKLGLTKYLVDSPLIESGLNVDSVEIPLKQHIGAKALPCVSIGDHVAMGQVIGEMEEGKLGTPIHSSINGLVKNITENMILIERGM